MDTKLQFSCIDLLIKINRSHKKLIDYGVSTKIGLHRTQHIILMKLSKNSALPSQKELARDLGISAAAISGALDKLEVDGYIERRSGSDNRFNEIVITDRGLSVVNETRELFSKIDAGVLADFSDDELCEIIKFLEKINNNIQNIVEV